MSDTEIISLEKSVIIAAAERAEREGLSIEDYIMRVLMREMELDARGRTILAYDAVGSATAFVLEREEGESDEAYEARREALGMLFS
ncbi:hypothetical protein [Bradyrhizobium sp. HKCCYLS20291]|uniref:hypothetical protein n=1 Tax=Bradyrhizobium sp. HKCCYLS20291 TaxID=3420766 RepID=UPI003EB6D4C8